MAEQSALGPTGRWFEPSPDGALELVLAVTAGQKGVCRPVAQRQSGRLCTRLDAGSNPARAVPTRRLR